MSKKYKISFDDTQNDNDMTDYIAQSLDEYINKPGLVIEPGNLTILQYYIINLANVVKCDSIELITDNTQLYNAVIRISGKSIKINNTKLFRDIAASSDGIVNFVAKTDGTVEIELCYTLKTIKKREVAGKVS